MSLKEKFIYENERGERIEFSPLSDFFLINISGTAGLQNIINSNKNISDGITVNSTSLSSRNILIQGKLKKVNRDYNRLKLIKVLNPKLKGKLIYQNDVDEPKYIECLVESSPDPVRDAISTFQISLICEQPNWKNYYKIGEQISTWIGGWKFKFKLPFRFKQKGEPRKNIYNEGDVETPVEIVFKGPAVNPKVSNITTGDYIRIKQTLTSDDILYINTERGNKTVEIERNGARKNAFNYIDLNSTFFQLIPGDNLIEYSSENNLDPQSVEIKYRHRYLGI